jgi:hypothetical protein
VCAHHQLTTLHQTQQLITISGNDYSSVSGWVGTNSLWMGPSNITDPLNNWYGANKIMI